MSGEGHFLGQPETFVRMKTDFLNPGVADRRSPDGWPAEGDRDIRNAARNRVKSNLASHYPEHMGPDLRQQLRAGFGLKLEENA